MSNQHQHLLDQIALTKKLLSEHVVHTCEIFSRVVGYYRPIKQWNKGKQEEWKVRAKFDENLKGL